MVSPVVTQAVGRPFQEDPSPEGARRLAGDRRDDPIEVVPRQVQARSELLARRLVVVERVGEDVHEGDERVAGCGHAPMMACGPNGGA